LTKYYEEFDRIKSLNQTYNKYAFPVQMEFLTQRFNNEWQSDKIIGSALILDRCFYEDYHIFAKATYKMGWLKRPDEQSGV